MRKRISRLISRMRDNYSRGEAQEEIKVVRK